MSFQRLFAIVLLVPFTVLSAYAVMQVGYIGIVDYAFASPAGWQVFADLVIALLLVFNWLIPEAKRAGINPWPWVVITLFLGSFGPLLYLALHGKKARRLTNSMQRHASERVTEG
ncbi:MAG: DUF2834 domain-containing protein [Aestuariibacter sp.]